MIHRRAAANRHAAVLALALAAFLSVGAAGAAAEPQISWIFSPGGQRGTVVTAEIHGTGLAKLAGLFCAGSGLKVTVLPAPTPKKGADNAAETSRKLRIEIAKDAPLGASEIRAYDREGISNVKMFQVGQWPEFQETEPNDQPDQANRVSIPVTINGQIDHYSDQDCYRFAATAGHQISCAVYSERILSFFDDSWLKGSLEVLDPHGRSIAWNDGRFHWDAVINFTAPETGDYTVRFHDLQWRGSPAAVYRLTIGSIPYALAAFPPGVRRGSTVKIAFAGTNLGPDSTEVFRAPADPADSVQDVRLHTPQGDTNPVSIQIGADPEYTEQEPNDDDAHANRVTPPVVINGILERAGDHDYFKFHADAKQRLVFETFADRVGSPVDTFLTLRDASGGVMAENDDARDRDSLIDRTFDKAGDYTIEVRDVDEGGGPDYTYRLRIGPPPTDFKLLATPDHLTVPAGGAARVDVHMDRDWDFDGSVDIHVEGLPPGMTASAGTIPKGRSDTAITIQADPSVALPAPPSAIRVVGTGMINGHTVTHSASTQEQYNLQGTAYQRTVIGPLAMPGPSGAFTLAAASGTVELSASKETRVDFAIKRAKGVKGPVKLRVDGLPEGVTADPVEIAAGAETGALVLKAAEDAPASAVSLLVTGTLHDADNKDSDALAPAVQLKLTEVPTFRVAGPDHVDLAAGKTAGLKVDVTRRGGYGGAITLKVSGLPFGVTADAAQIDAGKDEAQITLHASKTARPTADKPIVVHVDGAGVFGTETRTRSTPPIKLAITG